MLCENYNQLSHAEKIIFIGELIHIVQNDNEYFNHAKKIIEIARENNRLKNVTILPTNQTILDA